MTCPEVRCWCIGAGPYEWQPDHDRGHIVCPMPVRHQDRCAWYDALPPQRCGTGAAP